jgi:hypothetical protein
MPANAVAGESIPDDLQALTNLHLRIQQHAAAGHLVPVLINEIANLARDLLLISSRMIERSHERPDLDTRLSPPNSDTSSDEDEDDPIGEHDLDIVSVLMVVAGYEKLYDMMAGVSARLRAILGRLKSGAGIEAIDSPEPIVPGATNGNSQDTDAARRTLIQLHAVAHRISGILERFIQGQEHLTAALNVEYMNYAAAQGVTEDSMEGIEGSASIDRNSFGQGVFDLLDALEARNGSLSEQVALVKQGAQEASVGG